jgi:hypothetical protein
MLGSFVTLDLARRKVREQLEMGPTTRRLRVENGSPRGRSPSTAVARLLGRPQEGSRASRALPCPEGSRR